MDISNIYMTACCFSSMDISIDIDNVEEDKKY